MYICTMHIYIMYICCILTAKLQYKIFELNLNCLNSRTLLDPGLPHGPLGMTNSLSVLQGKYKLAAPIASNIQMQNICTRLKRNTTLFSRLSNLSEEACVYTNEVDVFNSLRILRYFAI